MTRKAAAKTSAKDGRQKNLAIGLSKDSKEIFIQFESPTLAFRMSVHQAKTLVDNVSHYIRLLEEGP